MLSYLQALSGPASLHWGWLVDLTRKQMLKGLGGAGLGAVVGLRPGVASAGTGQAPRTAAAAGAAQTVNRDVCIVGGGSSGTYTAIRLRDLGMSVALVERKDRLGGHTETYHDPVTGATTDIGVLVFHDLPIVRDYFARFGVPLAPFTVVRGSSAYVDFRTGQPVAGYVPPAPTALGTYAGILQQYPYLENGFSLPDPVPAPLLMPFGDFVTQYGLQTIVQTVFSFGEGLGDILHLPAIYVMKNFGLGVVSSIFANSFLTTANHDNSALYEQAAAYLGDDVLLNAFITQVSRDSSGVTVQAYTPGGPCTIKAAKLVITGPPLLDNLIGFDLDATELLLFSQFRPVYFFTGLVQLTGLPDNLAVYNIGADTLYNLPPLPVLYAVHPSDLPGLYWVKYCSTTPISGDQVQANIAADIARLASAGTYPVSSPVFVAFSSHSPFELHVSSASIATGFYHQLYALQGHRRTFYNGAAFHTHDSSLLWQFTENLLPSITA